MASKFYGVTRADIPKLWRAYLSDLGAKTKTDIGKILDENDRFVMGRCRAKYPVLLCKRFGRLGIRYNEFDVKVWFNALAIMLCESGKLKEVV